MNTNDQRMLIDILKEVRFIKEVMLDIQANMQADLVCNGCDEHTGEHNHG